MNKPTFNSTRLRAAALAMTLSMSLAQTFLAPAAAMAATEAPVSRARPASATMVHSFQDGR